MIGRLRGLFIILCLYSINVDGSTNHRHRRYVNLLNRQKRWAPHTIDSGLNPSGSIPGTAYYGVGSDPNYGSFIQRPNSPNSGILSISYNPNSNAFSYLINPSHSHQQSSNGNNRWYSSNQNNYPMQPGSRYPPGSPGWFATGGNYWYNHGQTIVIKPFLYIISLIVLFIFK